MKASCQCGKLSAVVPRPDDGCRRLSLSGLSETLRVSVRRGRLLSV